MTSRAGTTFWTFSERCRLRDLMYRGLSPDEIAAVMGRSRSAIVTRAQRMGLSFRDARLFFAPSGDWTEAERLAAFARVPLPLAEMVISGARARRINPKALRSESREPRLVSARKYIARAASEQGFSQPEIGRALNRDHSTIGHHIRAMVGA